MVTSIPSGVGGTILDLTKISSKLFDQAKLAAIVKQVAEFVINQAKGTVKVDTGKLQSSIEYALAGLLAHISANTDYAAAIEFGHVTRSGSFVAPSPYMQPAIEDGIKLLKTLVQKHVEMALRA